MGGDKLQIMIEAGEIEAKKEIQKHPKTERRIILLLIRRVKKK